MSTTPTRPSPSIGCFNIIKEFEGCSLKAYTDPASGNLPITIGWGSTMYKTGKRIMMGDSITQLEADDLLAWEVGNKSTAISIPNNLRQCQFDAIVSFAYNLGISAYQNSTLRKKININPSDPTIQGEFMRWVNGGGHPMEGLIKRRAAEWQLYNS